MNIARRKTAAGIEPAHVSAPPRTRGSMASWIEAKRERNPAFIATAFPVDHA